MILELDKDLLLAINHHHSELADFLMWWCSDRFIWIPFYAFIVGLIIFHYRMRSILILLTIALLIVLSDQLASGIFKPLFKRLRPSHEPGLEETLHYVNNYKGGTYGFISSHACNVFALAFFLFFMMDRKVKWLKYILFPWACMVSYSRVYLGVHYPLDILVAACLSIPIAYLMNKLYILIKNKYLTGIIKTNSNENG